MAIDRVRSSAMPDSRPPIFDDGGGLPDVDRSRRRQGADNSDRARGDGLTNDPSDARPGRERDVWDDADDEQWRSPNFLFRRAIVVGAVLLLIAGIVIGASRFLGGGGDGSGSGLGNADWNSIVTIDDNVGTVVITDTDGEETNRFRLGLSPLIGTAIIDRTLVVTDADALGVVRLDADADIAPADVVTVDIESTGSLLRPSGTTQTAVTADASSERLVMVHGPSGEIFDTADTNTVPGARYDLALAIAEPAGRNVLVTDSGNFQSVLFSFEREEPSFFPGLALAVNDDIVVTAANVGTNANVAVFDHTGAPGVAAQTTSVRAAIVGQGSVVLVGVDGEVLQLSLANGDIAEVGNLSIGTVESGHVSISGERLIVTGADGTAIVSDDGTIVAELPGARPTTSGLDAVAPRGSTCLVVERPVAGEVAVIDLETGTVGSEALANADVLSPVDGCRPVSPTSAGYISIDIEAVTPVTVVGDVVAISPDGGTLAIERTNRLELAVRATSDASDEDDNEDEAEEPVDVGRAGRATFFADL